MSQHMHRMDLKPRSFRFLAIALFVLVGPGCASLGIPGAEDLQVTDDGAWCWFQDPRAVYIDGTKERTYTAWMTREGSLVVGAIDHQSEEMETFVLKENWDADDHNTASLLVLPDNRIMACYARHNRTGLYCRQTLRPEDITSWRSEATVSNTDRITYSHPVYLSEEKKFYIFWRGPSWKPTFAWSRDGETWSESAILLQDEGREAQSIRPYLKVSSDGVSTIHLAFTDGHPRNEPFNSLYYLKYQNGEFLRADGTRVGLLEDLPIPHAQTDRIYDATTTGIRAWVWDIASDAEGRPVVVYTRLPDETDHRYHYARWNGHAWEDNEIVPAGGWFPETIEGESEPEPHYSAGIALHRENPDVVYLSRPVNGQFEIERWRTSDMGSNWTRRRITGNSDNNSVRPVVPAGLPARSGTVLWMNGSYEHYTRFQTSIRIKRGSDN